MRGWGGDIYCHKGYNQSDYPSCTMHIVPFRYITVIMISTNVFLSTQFGILFFVFRDFSSRKIASNITLVVTKGM